MALRNGQGQRKKYLTLELSSVSDLVENVCAIVSEFQSAKIGDENCYFQRSIHPFLRQAGAPYHRTKLGVAQPIPRICVRLAPPSQVFRHPALCWPLEGE